MTRRTIPLLVLFVALALPGCSGDGTGGGGAGGSEEGPFEYVQGIHRMEQGNVFGASFLLEKAVAKYPDFLPARYKLVEAYVALAGQDSDYFENVYPALEEIKVRVGEDDTDYRKALAKAYIAQGRSDEAIAVYEDILADDPDNCEHWMLLGRAEIQKAIILRGEEGLQAQMDMLHVAEKTFRNALELCPDRYESYYGKAVLLEQTKAYEELSELYRDLMKKFPDNPDPLRSYANSHYMRRDFEEAGRAYAELLDRDPREEDRLKYIVALKKIGNEKEAERQSEIHLANQPREEGPIHRTKLDILKERLNVQPRTDEAGALFEDEKVEEALALWEEVRADVAPEMENPEFAEAAQELIVWLDRRINLARTRLAGEN